jgi:hypothetical protein
VKTLNENGNAVVTPLPVAIDLRVLVLEMVIL